MSQASLRSRDGSRTDLVRAIEGRHPLVGYVWYGWKNFLLERLAPHTVTVEADPVDTWDSLRRRLPSTPGVFLFHINCTDTRRFPVGRAEIIEGLLREGWSLANDAVDDISKRELQRRLVEAGCNSVAVGRDGPPDEQLVIKSNYNYGGKPERGLPPEVREALGLDPLPPEEIDPAGYKFIPRSKIPDSAWSDTSLAIERFHGNQEGYYFRAWIAGTRVHLAQLQNPENLKKIGESRVVDTWRAAMDSGPAMPTMVRRVLDEARTGADAMGLTFGALDLVMNDQGDPFIIDLNVTPSFNLSTRIPGLVEYLSGGTRRSGSLRLARYGQYVRRVKNLVRYGPGSVVDSLLGR